MAKEKNEKKRLSEWLIKYRLILFLSLIVLTIVILVTIVYAGNKSISKRINFAKDDKTAAEKVHVKNFIDYKDFKDLLIKIEFSDLTAYEETKTDPATGEEVTTVLGQTYQFKVSVSNTDVSEKYGAFKLTFALQADWSDNRGYSAERAFTYPGSTYTININHTETYPHKPLWFVSVPRPTLYIKVSYTPVDLPPGIDPNYTPIIPEIAYLKVNLNDFPDPKDLKAVNSVYNSLAIGYAESDSSSSVTKDLTLPTEIDGVKISWTSSDESFISPTGVVTPSTTQNHTITLTAKITSNKAERDRIFYVTVKKAAAND